MAQLNPILVRLQKKIEDYNKDVQRKIDDVAYRQKIVAVGIVCFDLVVLFLSNYLLPDDSKDESLRLLSLFSNDQLSILITVISIGFSLSTASLIGRNSFKELKIDETIIEPKLQYAGEWEYLTEFRIQTKDDGSTEYQRFKGSVRKACCVDGVCPKEADRKLHNMLIFSLKSISLPTWWSILRSDAVSDLYQQWKQLVSCGETNCFPRRNKLFPCFTLTCMTFPDS